MIITKLLSLFILFAAINLYSQTNEVVAEIGDTKITAREFKLRYELMPKLSEFGFNADTLKNEFIHSLIAEKLWAKEAESEGYSNDGYFLATFGQLEKLFLKDALFKQEVESKIIIADEELERGMVRSRYTLNVQIWSGPDSADTYRIHELIGKGLSFDSIGIPEIDITYGSMDEDRIEDLLYSLKPGEYSDPVKVKNGWFIFHIKNRIFSTRDDYETLLSRVNSHLKERKARETGRKFLSGFLKDVKADADTNMFKLLADKITDELRSKTPDELEKKENTLFLSEVSVKKIMESYSSAELDKSFININNKSLPLYEFLSFLKSDILAVRSADKNIVMLRLKYKIDYFIEQELLSEEARRRNLHLSNSYQDEIRLWKENYLAQMLRTKFMSGLSANDEEVYEFYLELSNRIDTVNQLNILEILSNDLDVVENVLNELGNGRDFRELAGLYTEREWTKSKGGEFGLFPINLFREISEIAVNMNVGEVYGPLKLPEGFSIFKLIEKKDAVKSYSADYETVKEQLRNDLLVKKYQDLIEDETFRLAEKYQVRINRDLLGRIKVLDVEMFTYRYIGFGGKIAAVPYTTPWHNWKKKIILKNL
jgi:parvulin-like peptidyl-prolyl isomerase